MQVTMTRIKDNSYAPSIDREHTPGQVKTYDGTSSIYFVGPYPPIMCGIADYTKFIVNKSPIGRWGMISFDLKKYGNPLTDERLETGPAWYGIPGRDSFSASEIMRGLSEIGSIEENIVLWFQHENGIWPDDDRFVTMLRELDVPKVVTFHTIHFQSPETRTGMHRNQYDLLKKLLPCVEAITVFSNGAYRAVTSAFPQYIDKVHIMKHGIHSYPEVSLMSRKEAKERFNDYLLYESSPDPETKKALYKQRVFLDPDTIVVGQTGFLAREKGTELLYIARNKLQKLVPHRRIVAVRIGSPRDESQKIYAERLRQCLNGRDEFLLVVPPRHDTLPLSQRAFDVNFYWPNDCTQSGIMAHALGGGAVVAARDMEGVGETLKEAGQVVDADLDRLLLKTKNLILNPELGEKLEETASKYAEEYSWKKQAQRHYQLAERITPQSPVWSAAYSPLTEETVAITAATKSGNEWYQYLER
jgi:glycosyltransferase involved in cell wall biosynthesis